MIKEISNLLKQIAFHFCILHAQNIDGFLYIHQQTSYFTINTVNYI